MKAKDFKVLKERVKEGNFKVTQEELRDLTKRQAETLEDMIMDSTDLSSNQDADDLVTTLIEYQAELVEDKKVANKKPPKKDTKKEDKPKKETASDKPKNDVKQDKKTQVSKAPGKVDKPIKRVQTGQMIYLRREGNEVREPAILLRVGKKWTVIALVEYEDHVYLVNNKDFNKLVFSNWDEDGTPYNILIEIEALPEE